MGLQIFSEASNFCFTVLIELFISFDDTAVTGLLLTKSDINHIIKVDPYFKHKFKLRFTVYGTPEITQQLINITKSFSTIWKNHGLSVNLSKQDWMAINLKEGAEPQSGKVYPVSHWDWKVIDEIFNKIHEQKKIF